MPKRPQVDESSSPIAQTNATLHQFVGSTHLPWMQSGGSGSENGRANGERADGASAGGSGRSGQAAKQQNSMSHTSNGALNWQHPSRTTFNPPTTSLAPTASIHSNHGTSAEPIDLVDYESPYAMHNLPTPSPSTAHAHTRIASAGPVNYVLPSPAQSDGITPPPALTRPDSAQPTRQRGRLPSIRPSPSIANTFTASPTMASPLSGASIYPPSAAQSSTVQTSREPRNRSNPNLAPPVVLHSNAPSSISPGVQFPHEYAHPAQVNSINPFYKDSMLQTYHGYFEQPSLVLNETDIGRKIMLLDAIQKDDFFYLILSQMFCLQTVLPNYVPQQLSGLPEESWKSLKRLLRGNEHCSHHVVHWFAQFPAPITLIHVSGVAGNFYQQLNAIRSFLLGLPAQLEPLIEKSRKRLAPPLTQDMVDKLHLPSPILQTTLFRMISRLFWGSNDNKGLQILEYIHRIDQDTYFFQQFRRTATEKNDAYQCLAAVYANFQAYVNAGGRQDDFVSPSQIVFFQTIPASMAPTRQAQAPAQQNYVLQHQYAQQVQNVRPAVYPPPVVRPPSVPHYNHEQVPAAPPRHVQRLMPGEKDLPRSQPVHPDTSRVALHQSHLRSPIPGLKELPRGAQPLYRHVVGYALNPTQIWSSQAQTISFMITQAELDKIPKVVPPKLAGDRGTRFLSEGSFLYRLRCSALPTDGFQTENAWVTADNVWPTNLVFMVNAHYLDVRRKLHHGRYLPADISSLLHVGENTLTIFSAGAITTALAVGIEAVGVSTHASILSNLNVQSSADSLNAIKQSLSSRGKGDEDDDIVMTSGNLTINLFDPFTADRIFKIPVRGSACLHRDCFDLETFLSQCKRDKPGYPCIVDCWRCPICKSDVRPQTLLKDGFLVEVRVDLEKRGLLQTRAILVEQDGTWNPKLEEQATGIRSPSLEREEAVEAERAKTKKVVEIIDLDSP